MLYKIKDKQAVEVDQGRLQEEQDLEDLIENQPSVLGETLLVIGRQVKVPDVNDRIDLLALDIEGNIVIIELKRGSIKDPVDIQSLRYASYISRWEYNELENQAKSYFLTKGNEDFNFNESFEEFCTSAGIDDIPELNQEQRIVVVGHSLKEKIGSVALWLRDHDVDIRIVEYSLYKDGDNQYLSTQLVIPSPTTEKFEIGKSISGKDRSKPWVIDGQDWHLNKRCGSTMKDKLLQLNAIINDNFDSIEGPEWDQKSYISFKELGHIWMYVKTYKTALVLTVRVKTGDMDADKISKALGIKIFDKTFSLSEKLQLDSSIELVKSGDYDRVRIRIKEDFNMSSNAFLEFLRDSYNSFKKVI